MSWKRPRHQQKCLVQLVSYTIHTPTLTHILHTHPMNTTITHTYHLNVSLYMWMLLCKGPACHASCNNIVYSFSKCFYPIAVVMHPEPVCVCVCVQVPGVCAGASHRACGVWVPLGSACRHWGVKSQTAGVHGSGELVLNTGCWVTYSVCVCVCVCVWLKYNLYCGGGGTGTGKVYTYMKLLFP